MSLYRFESGNGTVLYTGTQRAADLAEAMRDYIETVPELIFNEKLIEELKNYNPYEEKEVKEESKLEFLTNLK